MPMLPSKEQVIYLFIWMSIIIVIGYEVVMFCSGVGLMMYNGNILNLISFFLVKRKPKGILEKDSLIIVF